MFTIREYQPSDKPCLIELFLLNTPAYFHPDEQADLDEYLETEIEHYFVFEDNGLIIASGGSNIEDGIGCLSWYVVHPAYHAKGAGSRLVSHNLQILTADPRVTRLVVRTSQLVYKFYTKFGYELKYTKANYWGEGFDLYHMEKSLSQSL
jgi:[ribosomal protein S18]-alanine N-acetyltransferase